MIEKALDIVYDMSFTARCHSKQVELKERLITKLYKYKKNQKQFADLHINAESFFMYYSSNILRLNECVCPVLKQLKKVFYSTLPVFSFQIFYFVMCQIKQSHVSSTQTPSGKKTLAKDGNTIKQLLAIIVKVLIRLKYIKAIKHIKTGCFLTKPDTMLDYFINTLFNFKTLDSYQMPELFSEVF